MSETAHIGKYGGRGFNEEVILYDGPGSLLLGPVPASNETIIEGNIRLFMTWSPSPRIGVTFTYSCSWTDREPQLIPHRVQVPGGSQTSCSVLGITTSYESPDKAVRRIDARLTAGMLVGEDIEVTEVLFHLANFPQYSGEVIPCRPDDPTMRTVRRLPFSTGEWLVELDTVEDWLELYDQLRVRGGYGITNVGSIRRADGIPFTRPTLLSLATRLHLLFSSVAGGWCPPMMFLGQSEDSQTVAWEWWDQPGGTSVERMWTWLPHSVVVDGRVEVPDLTGMARELVRLAEDADLHQVLRRVVRWQVEAAGAPRDTGIVLAQAGLELLAWVRLVRLGTWSRSSFDDAPAHERLRALLEVSGIPTDVPPRFWHLREATAPMGLDAPRAVTKARNSIVHPLEKAPFLEATVRDDAHHLSLQLLDLCLLSWLTYDGSYTERSAFSAVERVPWSSLEEA